MLDTPVKTALSALIVAVIIFAIGLWLMKPRWVCTIDKNGNEQLSIELVMAFSITFSLVVAIAVLMFNTKNTYTAPAIQDDSVIYL